MDKSPARKPLFGSRFRPYPKPPVFNPTYKHPHAILTQCRGPCGDPHNANLSPSEVSLNIYILLLLSLLY